MKNSMPRLICVALSIALGACGEANDEAIFGESQMPGDVGLDVGAAESAIGPEVDGSSVSTDVQADVGVPTDASADSRNGLTAPCTITAHAPTWAGGATHGWGSAICPSGGTIAGSIGLERSNRTTVGTPATATKSVGTTRVYWERRADGCNSILSYRSVFTGNRVIVRSVWKRGCS